MRWVKNRTNYIFEMEGGPFTNDVTWDQSLLGKLFNILGGKLRNKNAKDRINYLADELMKLLQDVALTGVSEEEKKEIKSKLNIQAIGVIILELRERAEKEVIQKNEFDQIYLECMSKLEAIEEGESKKYLMEILTSIEKSFDDIEQESEENKNNTDKDVRELQELIKKFEITIPDKTKKENIEEFIKIIDGGDIDLKKERIPDNIKEKLRMVIKLLGDQEIYEKDIRQTVINFLNWIGQKDSALLIKSLSAYVESVLNTIKNKINSNNDKDKGNEETGLSVTEANDNTDLTLYDGDGENGEDEEVENNKVSEILNKLSDDVIAKIKSIIKNNKIDPKSEEIARENFKGKGFTPEVIEKIVEIFSQARKSIVRNLGGMNEDKKKTILKNYEKLDQSSDMYKNIMSWTQWEERISKITTRFEEDLKKYKNGALLEFFLNSVDDEYLLNFNKLVRDTLVKAGIILKNNDDDIKNAKINNTEDNKITFKSTESLKPSPNSALIIGGDLTETSRIFNNGSRNIVSVIWDVDNKKNIVWLKFKIDSYSWLKSYTPEDVNIIGLESISDSNKDGTYFGYFKLDDNLSKKSKINVKYGVLKGNDFSKFGEFDLDIKRILILSGNDDNKVAKVKQPEKDDIDNKDIFIDFSTLRKKLINNFK